MRNELYYNTASEILISILKDLMNSLEFKDFRLVGGTSLSLQLGHRISVDIDLFSDLPYGEIDFDKIEKTLAKYYPYVYSSKIDIIGFGKSYFVGENESNCIKLDIYYSDKFIQKPLVIDGIRMATIEEIIAMKIDVISRNGRKKDFWDLHELMKNYSLADMIKLHEQRYPFTHDQELIKEKLINFKNADDDFDPICLKHKYWEVIKLDFLDFVK